ncbi:hypothetical protein GCM10010389_22390 [Streptomyces echinoruber]|uniref:Uncharacterized protein n=1 Tax=Streptomyces echinoruber TaxID=68898 RepID=A0A918R417_9ACTN|nr:hypothetical protein GCM10010389_22390 [Streptomyces echinoruber]
MCSGVLHGGGRLARRGAVSLAVALLLGRAVVRGGRAPAEATRALAEDGRFTRPATAPTAELA